MGRTVTFKGDPLALEGAELQVGQPAPDFKLVERSLEGLKETTLADFKGKVLVLNVVPSLDTGVCQIQTRRANQEIQNMPANIEVLTVSMDLPFAQGRFADAEGIERVRFGSDHRDENFAKGYGLMVRPLRLLQRSLFVIDQNGVLQYAEYVPEIAQEPNYEPAFAKARELAGA